MPRVRFTGDFDYRPRRHVVIAYKSGHDLPVKQDCADQAVAAGKAVLVGKARPAKAKDPAP
jgi:hypothetical protein